MNDKDNQTDQLEADYRALQEELSLAKTMVGLLQAENKKLRKALEFYAGHFINENNNTKLILHDDFGVKAREALKEIKE